MFAFRSESLETTERLQSVCLMDYLPSLMSSMKARPAFFWMEFCHSWLKKKHYINTVFLRSHFSAFMLWPFVAFVKNALLCLFCYRCCSDRPELESGIERQTGATVVWRELDGGRSYLCEYCKYVFYVLVTFLELFIFITVFFQPSEQKSYVIFFELSQTSYCHCQKRVMKMRKLLSINNRL